MSTTRWLVVGTMLYLGGSALAVDAPQVPGARYPLRSPLLFALPITTPARVLFALLQLAFLFPMGVAGVLGASGATDVNVAVRVVLAVLVVTTGALAGLGLATIARLAVPPHRLAKLAWVGSLISVAGILLAINAELVGTMAKATHPLDPTVVIARGVAGVGSVWAGLGWLVSLSVAGLLAITIAEHVGYDRLDAAPPTKPRGEAGPITKDNLERIVAGRETGGRVLGVILFAMVGGSTILAWKTGPLGERAGGRTVIDAVGLGIGFVVAQIGASVAMARASRSVFRDAQARPMLAPLPLAPHDTLRGKERALRRQVLPLALLWVPWVVLGPAGAGHVFAWRAVVTAAALWILCDAAVSIAFLTNGLGAPSARTAGAPMNIASMLLLLPFLNAVLATHPFAAVVSLATLLALALEARRAAYRCVEWIDDADQHATRETEVWRALLVLGGFYAIQVLTARLVAFFAAASPSLVTAAAYSIAAIALVLMTQNGGVRIASLPVVPRRLGYLPLGVLAGAVTGAMGLGYQRILHAFGVASPAISESPLERWALGFAIVVLAPLSEEIFFRGWLQAAIERELPRRLARWAFAVAALAFAAAHPPISFVPVLVLGLAAGGLFTRSGALGAGMLAHATHNLIAMTLGG